MDENTVVLLVGLCLIVLGAFLKLVQHYFIDDILEKQKLEYRPSKVNEDLPLGTGNSIGFSLIQGVNFHRYYNGIQVFAFIHYHFFVLLFLPIVPLGCYDARVVGRKHKATTYQIKNKQEMNKWEVLWIYSFSWGIGLIAIGLIMFVCSLFSYL